MKRKTDPGGDRVARKAVAANLKFLRLEGPQEEARVSGGQRERVGSCGLLPSSELLAFPCLVLRDDC